MLEALGSRDWHGRPGGSEAAIDGLKAAAHFNLPSTYLALLREFNGGEGPLPIQPCYIILDPAEVVVETEQHGTFRKFFPGFFVIGSNGGGEAIAFDTRKGDNPPVVYFDMTNCDLAESVRALAGDFESLLDMIGLEQQ